MLADFHPVHVVTHRVDVEHREDGSRIIRSVGELCDYPERITDRLDYWATQTPERPFVSQRPQAGTDHQHWQTLNYADTRRRVRAIAQWLLDLRIDGEPLSQERPIVILSGNSSEHLLLALAAMYVGIPYAPVSTAYSTISTDFGKLRHIVETLTPGLVFADNLGPYRDAIDAVLPGLPVVAVVSAHGNDGLEGVLTPFDTLINTTVTDAVDQANRAVSASSIAKFLFTSGSTGMPKGVINTHKMLCANQAMLASVLAFVQQQPPVVVDWLPWNHTFGGNHNVGLVLFNGGSLYIDQGKPVPKAMPVTLDNLRDISPTVYFNVPKGFELLAQGLKDNPDVAANFYRHLNVMYFAGAGLAQHVWDALDELAIQHTGRKVPMLTGLGSTETGPAALFASIEECASGVVGVPAPGTDIKLVPNGGKLEARIRGLSITPGYWRDAEKTATAYDEEGFYCLGDALKFIDEQQPDRGFYFDGRVSEDFKLDTGTWVSVGSLRPFVIHHCAPYVQDLVIAGRDRGYISILVFPDLSQLHQLTELPADASASELVSHPRTREVFGRLLTEMAASSTGSSNRVQRLVIEARPPQLDAHEITDKGSINQNAVLTNRADTVAELYAAEPAAHIICLS
ncbi:feruloyl-CoA synthase [Oceanobacter sp. 4_MG-2023]|uniref:feruloyl-CoA synthase n=1 Tax=Oceanobacter sp. 4_MG-2023 TaxID=3062623 RepID=UPI0027336A2F|nr:feruloyl-CoA synthase [Oceanobacter sp. 4_MG-2023]MDP2548414.1 feruloyl-CoA synthase [Oceanobacter sp. 4_MG-2023]